MTPDTASALNPRTLVLRSILTVLLLLTLLTVAIAVCVFVIRIALPREPALSAGQVEDYAWDTPHYIPLQTDLAVFLVQKGDRILAVDATSPTSGCRIGWLEDQKFYRDPCCGATWKRDGTPRNVRYADLPPLTRYEVEVSEAGEIVVMPWREEATAASEPC